MTNRNLRVVSDNHQSEIIREDTHPIRYGNNQGIAKEQWQQIAHNLPVGESVSFTETTTRTVSRHSSTSTAQHHSGPNSAGDWGLVIVIMAVVVGVVVGALATLMGGL